MRLSHRVATAFILLCVISVIIQLSIVSANISRSLNLVYKTYICTNVRDVTGICNIAYDVSICETTNTTKIYYVLIFHSYIIILLCYFSFDKYRYIVKYIKDSSYEYTPRMKYINNTYFLTAIDLLMYITLSVMIGVDNTYYLLMSGVVLFYINISYNHTISQIRDDVTIHSINVKTEVIHKETEVDDQNVTFNIDESISDEEDIYISKENMSDAIIPNEETATTTTFNKIGIPEINKIKFRSGYNIISIILMSMFIILSYLYIKNTLPINIVGYNIAFTFYISHIFIYCVILLYLVFNEGIIRDNHRRTNIRINIEYVTETVYIISTTFSIIILLY